MLAKFKTNLNPTPENARSTKEKYIPQPDSIEDPDIMTINATSAWKSSSKYPGKSIVTKQAYFQLHIQKEYIYIMVL